MLTIKTGVASGKRGRIMGRCRLGGCDKNICCIECEERCTLPCWDMDKYEYSVECKEYVEESEEVLND